MAIITVRRANVLLRVPEQQKNEYLNKGFDVVGKDGEVLEHTTPSDANVLKREYIAQKKYIKELEEKLNSNENSTDWENKYNRLLDKYKELKTLYTQLEENSSSSKVKKSSISKVEKTSKKSKNI